MAGIIIFALSLLLVLAPIVLVGAGLQYFLGAKGRVSAATDKSASGDIIDAEFSVVETHRVEPQSQAIQDKLTSTGN